MIWVEFNENLCTSLKKVVRVRPHVRHFCLAPFPRCFFFFALSYLRTVGGQGLCWTVPSETWTRTNWWAFNMSELVIRWSSFWKMLVMITSSYIHPLCAHWDGQRWGSLSCRQVILHLSRLLSCWTMDRPLSEILHTWNLLATQQNYVSKVYAGNAWGGLCELTNAACWNIMIA